MSFGGPEISLRKFWKNSGGEKMQGMKWLDYQFPTNFGKAVAFPWHRRTFPICRRATLP
jgi:hypothetical protein